MVSVAREAVANQFRVNARAARLCVLEFLQNDAARPFAHHEAVAIAVVRAGSRLRMVVEAGRERLAGGKSRQRQPVDGRFGAARHHDVGVAERDQAAGVADRVSARRAGGDDGMIGPFELMRDGDLAADEVDQSAWDEEGRDAPGTLLVQRYRGVIDAAETADAGADHDAGLDLFLVRARRPVSVAERLGSRGHAEHNEVVDLPLLFRVHPVAWIEGVLGVAAGHLSGNATRQVGDVEVLDLVQPRFARDQTPPRRFDATSDRRNHSEAGDDYSPHGSIFHPWAPAAPAL